MLKFATANLAPSKLVSYILLKLSFLFLMLISFSSCSVPGMLNPDSYGRNHEVYAVDFNPKDLGSFNLYKMNEGDWSELGKSKNNQDAKFQIILEGDFLIVKANDKSMDVPTYQTWLNYARQQLGYTEESEYDIFSTVEDGWIYEIDLKKHPFVDGNMHRLLMYERK